MGVFEEFREEGSPKKGKPLKEIVIEEIMEELKKDRKNLNMDGLGDFDVDTEDMIRIFAHVTKSLETVTMKRWPKEIQKEVLGSILSDGIKRVTVDDAPSEVVSLIIKKCPNLETLETVIRAEHVLPLASLRKLTRLYHTDVRGVEPDLFSKMLEEERLTKEIRKNFFGVPLKHLILNQCTPEILDSFWNCMNLKTVEIHAKVDDITLNFLPDKVEELIIITYDDMYDKMEQKDLARAISETSVRKVAFVTDFVDLDAWAGIFSESGGVREAAFESGFPIPLKEDFLKAAKSAEKISGSLSVQAETGIGTYQVMKGVCDAVTYGRIKEFELADCDLSEVPEALKAKIAAGLGEACSKGNLHVFKGLDKVFTKENGMLSYYRLFLGNLKTSAVSFPMRGESGQGLHEVMQKRIMQMNAAYSKIRKIPKRGPVGKEAEAVLMEAVKNDLYKELLDHRKEPLPVEALFLTSKRGEYLFENCLRPMNAGQFYSVRTFGTLDALRAFERKLPEEKKHLLDPVRMKRLRNSLYKTVRAKETENNRPKKDGTER